MVIEKTDFLRLRASSDDSKLSGLAVSLWQGGVKVADLVQDTYKNWQYNFPAGITNGVYDLYINDIPVSGTPQIKVRRSGIVTAEDTDFAY